MTNTSESFYKILGVNEKASKEEIKKAYRNLSLKHHPDKTSNPESHQLFQKINEAYETLGDEQKRNEYDAMQNNPFMRMNSQFGGGGGAGGNVNIPVDEIFKAFFGGESLFGQGFPGQTTQGFHGGPGFPGHIFMGGPGFPGQGIPRGNIHIFTSGGGATAFKKPTPIIKTVEVSMEQVLNGSTIPVDIERWYIENGTKMFEHETLYVTIPKGADDNEIIILNDKGNMIQESVKGDVKIFIKVINDTTFTRNGLDLLYNKSVSLKEALCGFTFELKYLNGKMYTLNCNSGNIIFPGYKKILPNMGLTRDGHVGNLIIQFQVNFPEFLSEEQMMKLREIL